MVLAPMADVTDAAFRRVIAKYGKPDVMWTEFVSADGLSSRGREKLLPDLWFDESERPIVAQLFSGKPESMRESAKLCVELGFDGIDINMGCPEKLIEKSGAGACLMKHPDLAVEIIKATKEGAGDLPVSVKTRIGYKDNDIETWLPKIIAAEPAVITIHARTRNEMSDVPARWDVVARAVEIARELRPDASTRPLIFGNGDVMSLEEAEEKVRDTGCDGVMMGRAIFGNPWLFNREVNRDDLPLEERFEVMLEHTKLFIDLFTGIKPLQIMKKHYKAYINGFDGAAELRAKLMATNSYPEIEQLIRGFGK